MVDIELKVVVTELKVVTTNQKVFGKKYEAEVKVDVVTAHAHGSALKPELLFVLALITILHRLFPM